MQQHGMLARVARMVPIIGLLVSTVWVAPAAQADATCGTSGSHTICVSVPGSTLSGAASVSVTNSPNSGTVIATWVPSGKSAIQLITQFAPSPDTNDYSFLWPTNKYLDAPGTLRVYYGSTSNTPVNVPVSLSNGNVTDFQHSPNDWQNFLPNPSWTAPTDPIVAAVGDGASGEAVPKQLSASIAQSNPAVFLYLGDIYENGTFTENLNHYGLNSMDGGAGTLWGQMAQITQPAMGDHEAVNRAAWQDYFHGRPVYTSFTLGNVLFLDLASAKESMLVGSPQYNYVKSVLQSPTTPACVVAYFQNPALAKSTINSKRLPMWTLLTDNGGDLVLNGNAHTMIQYKPLNDQLQLPSPGEATMIELIAGSGGHNVGGTFTDDARVEWSKGQTPGAIFITLTDAANGGTPTVLNWAYTDMNGNVLHTGTRNCGAGPAPSPVSIGSFSPTSGAVGASVTISGSGFTGTTSVSFNGTPAAFTVDSDAQLSTTVPVGATSGPISVATPGGTATSSSTFTVIGAGSVLTFTPDADTWVESDLPDTSFGKKPAVKVDADPVKDGLLRFTVSGVGTSSIASAKLRLYVSDPSPDGGEIYRVPSNNWGESTVTWNTAPAADTSTVLGSLGAVTLATWAEVDLSNVVTGDGTYSIEIATSSANGSTYVSKEGTTGFAPQLVVSLS